MIEFKLARRRHLDSLLELNKICLPNETYDLDMWCDWLKQNLTFIALDAKKNYRAIGYCLMDHTSDTVAAIVSLAVHPEYQSQTIGTNLMNIALEHIRLTRKQIRHIE